MQPAPNFPVDRRASAGAHPDDSDFETRVLDGLAKAGWIVTIRHHSYEYVCEIERGNTRYQSDPCLRKMNALVQVAARVSKDLPALQH